MADGRRRTPEGPELQSRARPTRPDGGGSSRRPLSFDRGRAYKLRQAILFERTAARGCTENRPLAHRKQQFRRARLSETAPPVACRPARSSRSGSTPTAVARSSGSTSAHWRPSPLPRPLHLGGSARRAGQRGRRPLASPSVLALHGPTCSAAASAGGISAPSWRATRPRGRRGGQRQSWDGEVLTHHTRPAPLPPFSGAQAPLRQAKTATD